MDEELYSADELKALYHQRWFVEEDFKLIKKRMMVESFPGITPAAVTHHYYATLLARNITALLWFYPEQRLRTKETDNKLKYQTNKTLILSKMKDTLIIIFTRSAKIVNRLVTDLLHIFLRCTSPIRPNRSFPRNKRRTSKISIKYKPIR